MDKLQTWPLGTALAIIQSGAGRVCVRVQGVVTAMAYEALHLQLARETSAQREIVLDHDALLVMTPISAVDAAVRGTPARAGGLVLVGVPGTRFSWAVDHCQRLSQLGLARQAYVLDRQ